MKEQVTQAFGSWKSPVSPEMLGLSALRIGQTYVDERRAYWTESRPREKGRGVIAAYDFASGSICDISPAEYNVRSSVHEYGGGAAIVENGFVYFSNFLDHRVYAQEIASGKISVLSKESPSRYADFCLDKSRNRLILVREEHTGAGEEPLNFLDVLNLDGSSEPGMLLCGSDFFSSPRVSPDGRLLCWISWNHPNMPWDESTLWTANLGSDGSLSNIQQVAGGRNVSVTQPEWGSDGTLYFISDQSGWWNLYASYSGLVEPLIEMEAEFAGPQWIFGLSNYACLSASKIICSYNRKGVWNLAEFDTEKRTLRDIDTPYQDISYLRASNGKVVFRAGAPDRFAEIACLDSESGKIEVLKRANESELDSAYFSKAETIEFPCKTKNGKDSGNKAYAFFYPARNPEFKGPAQEKPPLIVKCHGGPTSAALNTLELGIQFWTTRGFSVVDVNYGGSSGFGRSYRERLDRNWGVVDVDDCLAAIDYLAESGLVDRKRVAITGGSAGGYTVLCALAFKGDYFACGASYYGVADLSMLALDTHKFESRYLDRLVGPFPEENELYEARSPLAHADKITCPVIFFQGLDDKVVPPSQSETMVQALKQKGLPVSYLSFEGESHGFRKAETIKSCLQNELSFYCRIFGIERDDLSKDLLIENSQAIESKSISAH